MHQTPVVIYPEWGKKRKDQTPIFRQLPTIEPPMPFSEPDPLRETVNILVAITRDAPEAEYDHPKTEWHIRRARKKSFMTVCVMLACSDHFDWRERPAFFTALVFQYEWHVAARERHRSH